MKKSILYSLFASALILMAVSCQKKLDAVATPANTTPPVININKIAPDGFTYSTSKTVNISVTALTNNDNPMAGVPMNLYTLNASGLMDKLIMKGFTDASGVFSTSVTIPAYCDTLVVDPSYIGLVRYAKILVNGSNISCTLGGSNGMTNTVGTLLASNSEIGIINAAKEAQGIAVKNHFVTNDINGVKTNTKFVEMGGYDSEGRPKYLDPVKDVIPAEMLASINASLPEQKNVASLHPDYISSSANSNIVITKKADVWITFVHEGAGYRNVLGYYTYKTGTPPQTLADITQITYIFPNCSLPGSGGNLNSGDKVKLGTFEEGTTIGLVIFSNGWNGSISTQYAQAFFSNENLNPESKASMKKHNVLLKFKDTYLIGFEDLNREYSGCDHDFNDVILYATSNPVEAISQDGVQQADTPNDSDGDGVTDTFDAYPKDAARAYVNYYPAKDVWGTLAFEDLWPYKGDYDLNDLVVKYNYTIVSSAKNEAVDMIANYMPVASGASYKNGFGIDLGIATSYIKSVTGSKLSESYIKLDGNGTESGQSNAVIIPFDNTQAVLKDASGNPAMNTYMAQDFVQPTTITMTISFAAGVSTKAGSSNSLVLGSLNPFLISNQKRGAEVHLPGFKPTKLADLSLLGQGHDATNPTTGIYYVTKENYPFALNFTESFQYPTEGSAINDAYTYFFKWAASGGTAYKDWYSNTNSDYRNTKLIYTK